MQTEGKPNVLWIFCDELRRDALGCYGNRYIDPYTPNIDMLAASGTIFDEYYVNAPVCVPSRMSLLTGLSPWHTGVYHNEAAAPGYPLGGSFATLPELFAAHGYRVQNCGKTHVPKMLWPWPSQEPAGSGMLRELVRTLDTTGARVVRSPGARSVIGGIVPGNMSYPPNAVTQHTIAAIDNDDGRPFFIRASYLQPHTPVLVPESWAKRHRPDLFPARPIRHPGLSRFETAFADINQGTALPDDEFQRAQALYHSLVGWVDEQVGLILERLAAKGLSGGTVVVLTTDHGAYLGEDGCFGKHTFAPQNQRVPLIVRAPETSPAGVRRADLAQGLDLAPTLLDLCGIPIPGQLEGRPLFGAQPAPPRVSGVIGYGAAMSRAFPNLAYGSYPGRLGWPRRACVRTSRYRLDLNVRLDGGRPSPEDEDVFLVDRAVDPEEVTNRAADPSLATVLQELRAGLLAEAGGCAETPDDLVYGLFCPPAPVVEEKSKGEGGLR